MQRHPFALSTADSKFLHLLVGIGLAFLSLTAQADVPFIWGSIPAAAWPDHHGDFCGETPTEAQQTARFCTHQYVQACEARPNPRARAQCLSELHSEMQERVHGAWIKLIAYMPPAQAEFGTTATVQAPSGVTPRRMRGPRLNGPENARNILMERCLQTPSEGRGIHLEWLSSECMRNGYMGILRGWASTQTSNAATQTAARRFADAIDGLIQHFTTRVRQLEMTYTRLCGAQTSSQWSWSRHSSHLANRAEVCRRGIRLTDQDHIAWAFADGGGAISLTEYMRSDRIPYGEDVRLVETPEERAQAEETQRRSRCRTDLEQIRSTLGDDPVTAIQARQIVARLGEECGQERETLTHELRQSRCTTSLAALRAETRRRRSAHETPLTGEERVAWIDADCTQERTRIETENNRYRNQATRNTRSRRRARQLVSRIDRRAIFPINNGREVTQLSCDHPASLTRARLHLYQNGFRRRRVEEIESHPEILGNLYNSLQFSSFLFMCHHLEAARRDERLATLLWVANEVTKMTISAYRDAMSRDPSIGDMIGARLDGGEHVGVNYFRRMLDRVFETDSYVSNVTDLFRQMSRNMGQLVDSIHIEGVDVGRRSRRLLGEQARASEVRDYFFHLSGPFGGDHPAPEGEVERLQQNANIYAEPGSEDFSREAANYYRDSRIAAIKTTLAQSFRRSPGLEAFLVEGGSRPLSEVLCPWIQEMQRNYSRRSRRPSDPNLQGAPANGGGLRRVVGEDGQPRTERAPNITEQGHIGHVGFPPVIADCFGRFRPRRR